MPMSCFLLSSPVLDFLASVLWVGQSKTRLPSFLTKDEITLCTIDWDFGGKRSLGHHPSSLAGASPAARFPLLVPGPLRCCCCCCFGVRTSPLRPISGVKPEPNPPLIIILPRPQSALRSPSQGPSHFSERHWPRDKGCLCKGSNQSRASIGGWTRGSQGKHWSLRVKNQKAKREGRGGTIDNGWTLTPFEWPWMLAGSDLERQLWPIPSNPAGPSRVAHQLAK